MGKDKVTIKDVARVAGFSTQTVSRVLNNRSDVSNETRSLVQQVINSLGYSPNVYARNLSRGRSNTIGVVGYGLGFYGSSSVLTGIENKANEQGFSLTLRLIDHVEPKKVDHILDNLLSQRVEGIIWAVPSDINTYEWMAERVSKLQTYFVYINKGPTDSDFYTVVDNRIGGKMATEHLMQQGYQRIGIITGPNSWWEAKERLMGWFDVVKSAGYSDIDNLIIEGDWNPLSGDVGLRKLLDRAPDIDAVFISNDQMALGALFAARSLNLKVPDDLGIVGFDDIPEAAYYFPPLTTIRQDTKKLGAMAIDCMSTLLIAQKEGVTIEPETSWLLPELIVRKSSIRINNNSR